MKYQIPISIVMPSYNVSLYIHEAIQSIMDQSYKNWELIIVDDASTDETVKVIHNFNDGRIKLFRFRENKGNYAARNYGIKQARGKYIAMMDADDISLPDRLRIQFEFMEKYRHIGAIGANFNIIDKKGRQAGKVRRNGTCDQFKFSLFLDNYMLQSSIFVRNYLLKKYNISYDERFIYAADYHFVFQCSKHFKILGIDDFLVSYRLNPNSITKTKFKIQQEFAQIIRGEIYFYYFGEILSKTDYNIIQDLTDKYFSKKLYDHLQIENLLNKILEYNNQKRILSQTKLYKVLYSLAMNYFIDDHQEQIEL